MKGAAPASTFEGASVAMVGCEFEISKETELLPGPLLLLTNTEAVPADAISPGRTDAVSCVLLTKVVGRPI